MGVLFVIANNRHVFAYFQIVMKLQYHCSRQVHLVCLLNDFSQVWIKNLSREKVTGEKFPRKKTEDKIILGKNQPKVTKKALCVTRKYKSCKKSSWNANPRNEIVAEENALQKILRRKNRKETCPGRKNLGNFSNSPV